MEVNKAWQKPALGERWMFGELHPHNGSLKAVFLLFLYCRQWHLKELLQLGQSWTKFLHGLPGSLDKYLEERVPLTKQTNYISLRKSPELKIAGGWESAGEGEEKYCLSALLVPNHPLTAIVGDRTLLWTTVTFLWTLTKICTFVKAGVFQRHNSFDTDLRRNHSQSQQVLITADRKERNCKLNLPLGM